MKKDTKAVVPAQPVICENVVADTKLQSVVLSDPSRPKGAFERAWLSKQALTNS